MMCKVKSLSIRPNTIVLWFALNLSISFTALAQCPNVTTAGASGCVGGNYTLTAASNGNPSVSGHIWYRYATGNETITPNTNFSPASGVWISSYTANFSTSTTYYVAAVCGGVVSNNRVPVSYTSSGGSHIGIQPSGSPNFCQGTNFTLTATGGTGYQWRFSTSSDGANSTSLGSSTVISPTQTGFYFLGGTTPCGQYEETLMPVSITPYVGTPSAPSGISSRCQGSGTSTYTSTASNVTSYSWSITIGCIWFTITAIV